MGAQQKKSGKKDIWKYTAFFWIFFLFFTGSIVLFFYLISKDVFGKLPTFEALENPKSELASEIMSSDGKVLGKYFSQNRSNAKYEELPAKLVEALIATEDIRFYEHSGIDTWAIFRAVAGMGGKGGGSTLSQQLAKNLFPRGEKLSKVQLVMRKFKEWIIAVRLERCYTKEEILTMYLNTVEFSSNSYGVKSAAKTYFNKQVDSLAVQDGAVLVGMLQAPSKFNPRRNMERSLNRRNIVLGQMKKYAYLQPEEFDSLKALPIALNYQAPSHTEGLAPYFREHLRLEVQQWLNEYSKTDTSKSYNLYTDGLKIYTTIDSRLQALAEKAMMEHMKKLQVEFAKQWEKQDPWKDQKDELNKAIRTSERYRAMKEDLGVSHDSIMKAFKTKIPMNIFTWEGEKDTVISPLDSLRHHRMFLQAGFMAVDPLNGNVKAWVGGINYKYFQYDHVTAPRQIGSTIKPFIYAKAIDNGYSPCFKILDVPYTFEEYDNWTPANAEGKFTGEKFTLLECLADSRNSCSAYLIKHNSIAEVIALMQKLGIESPIPPYPSIALGSPEFTLEEMVGAYTAFANKGIYSKPIYVTRIEDKNGNLIQEFPSQSTEAMSEQVAYIMVEMLRYVVNTGTGVRLRSSYHEYQLKADMGGKTGTTQNHSDGWFMGITPQLIAGAWVGGEDRFMRFNSMEFGQGARSAMPIWGSFFKSLYADSTLGYSEEVRFEKPADPLTIELDCTKYDKFEITKDPGKGPKYGGEWD